MTTTLLVLARTLHVGSAMLLVALPYFMLVVLRPVFMAGADAGYAPFCRRIVRSLWIAFAVEAVSGFAWFWLITAQMSDELPWGLLSADELKTVLWQTDFGRLWMARTAVGIALGMLLLFVSRQKADALLRPSPFSGFFFAVGSVLLLTLAWAGHAASGIHFHSLHLAADALHLFIGAIWPVSLAPMAAFLLHLHRHHHLAPAGREIASLQRFSRINLVAVLLLVATGIINALLMIGSWADLVTTPYGWLLTAKVAVVLLMIGLGAYNRFRLLPHLPVDPTLFRSLRRTVLTETLLAVVVLLIVGTMGMTAPPG